VIRLSLIYDTHRQAAKCLVNLGQPGFRACHRFRCSSRRPVITTPDQVRRVFAFSSPMIGRPT